MEHQPFPPSTVTVAVPATKLVPVLELGLERPQVLETTGGPVRPQAQAWVR